MKILYLPNAYSQQRQREKKANIYPVLMAMEAEWYRRQGHEVQWGTGLTQKDLPLREHPEKSFLLYKMMNENWDKVIREPEGLPFLSLPAPDRVFTKTKEYTSGNYKHLPGTHIQVASGCWWGKCSFCVENGKPYEVRPVEDVFEEIKKCKRLGFKEVFDDSATFPVGNWLYNFCNAVFQLKMCLGCNVRIDGDYDFRFMWNAGFRMVLFGVESANQITLNKINKGVKVEDIIPTIKKASKAGLEPHIAVMFGYPWETDDDAIRTLRMVHYLLKKGYAKTAQASFYTQQGVKSREEHRKFIRKIYNVGFSPEFWFNQLKDIKDKDDLRYLWRKIKAGLSDYKA